MATQKTFTAHDLTKDQQIVICPLEGGRISISSGYEFLDAGGEVISSLGTRDSNREIVFNTLPQAVRDFLIGLQNNVYEYHLQIEGMD